MLSQYDLVYIPLSVIHSRGLLPCTATVHPLGPGRTCDYESCTSTTTATPSACPAHPYQTGTQTGTVSIPNSKMCHKLSVLL